MLISDELLSEDSDDTDSEEEDSDDKDEELEESDDELREEYESIAPVTHLISVSRSIIPLPVLYNSFIISLIASDILESSDFPLYAGSPNPPLSQCAR